MREQPQPGWLPATEGLPTIGQVVRQVCLLGQLLQLPAQVGALLHALLLRNLEDHVPFQEFLNAFLVSVPALVQGDGKGEDAAWGTIWTGSGFRTSTLIPPG